MSEVLDYIVSVRRKLHQMPELSTEERETGDFIAAELKSMGHKVRRILTGSVVDVGGRDKTRTVALRCDIDALPIEEKTPVDFASKNGRMHACGHDGHTALLLALARELSRVKPAVNVRLIFQFGEEGEGGAEQMIEGGALDGVDEIYAFHLCPELDKGRISTCYGAMFAGTVEFDVEFEGLASHCASRGDGIDALAAAADFYKKAPSAADKYKSNTLFHTGHMTAGSARNIVADCAKLECTFRYFDSAAREAVMMNLAKLLTETDSAFRTTHRLTVQAVYPTLVNTAYGVDRMRSLGADTDTLPRYTAEDFAFYLQKTEGCMMWLGTRDETYRSPLHSDTFGFDESALLPGFELFKKLVY